MTRQFDLTLWNHPLYQLLLLPVLSATLVGTGAIWFLVLHQAGGKWCFMVFGTAILTGSLYGLEWLTRRPAQVLVTDKGLGVQYKANNQGFAVEWADVASYKEYRLNAGRELRLWTHAGGQVSLPVCSTYWQGYFEMVRTVEQAIAAYNSRRAIADDGTTVAAITQRVAFFETKAGLIILAAVSLATLIVTLLRCSNHP